MRKFTITGILAAAKFFSRKEGANESLENELRNLESQKQSKPPEEITMVDEDSLFIAFSSSVAIHCVSEVVAAVTKKYSDLGNEILQ
ncbi:MAG: hypothetical protein WCL02_01610 [bacterium]